MPEAKIDLDFVDTDEFDQPARDHVPVRSLKAEDLDAIVKIDCLNTGMDRKDYYERRLHEALEQSGIRVSLVAEVDDFVAGFIMARVDFGEFGRAEPVAVIDTLGVDPRYHGQGVGSALMSQLLTNLDGLQVEATRTVVEWNDFDVLAYMESCGFKPSQRLVFARKVPPAK
jgi:ribosomal protein S18 acetylase RimI-like enzyme